MAQPDAPQSGVEAVPDERLYDALRALDPVSRAVLDLSVRRGIPDDVIAGIVGTKPRRIAARRDNALVEVAATVGLTGADDVLRVRDALKQMDWRTGARETSPPAPLGEAERQGEPRRSKPRTDHTIGQAGERSVWFFIGAAAMSVLLAIRRRT
jgi:hypothetical protein